MHRSIPVAVLIHVRARRRIVSRSLGFRACCAPCEVDQSYGSSPEICPFSERDGADRDRPLIANLSAKVKSVVRLMLPPARIFSAECWPCRGLLFLSAIIASCRSPRRRRETDTAGPRLAPRPHGPPSSRLLIREALLHLPSCREPSGAPSLR